MTVLPRRFPSSENAFCSAAPSRSTPEGGPDNHSYPDAYDWASELGDRLGLTRRLVLGGALSQRRSEWTSLEGDFTFPAELYALGEEDLSTPTIYLALELLERAADPRPLLWFFKRVLLANERSRVVVAALDRADAQLPAASHYRSWTGAELEELLRGAGFEVGCVQRCRLHSKESQPRGLLLELSLSRSAYDLYLEGLELPSSALRRLVLTTEHGLSKLSGGIGSYVQEKEALRGAELGVALLIPEENLPGHGVRARHRWVLPTKLGLRQSGRLSDDALELVLQVLLLYPELSVVEIQDYLGPGARLVQAKSAGILPASLILEVVCHGAHVHLERAAESWLDAGSLPTVVEEQIALEGADRVVFGTRYIEQVYRDAGVRFTGLTRHQRQPFSRFTEPEPSAALRPVDTVVFFGKRSRLKGFPLFVSALQRLLEGPLGATQVRRVVLLGPAVEPLPEEDAWVDRFRRERELIELSLPREEALAVLAAFAASSVVVMPYLGDNHPVSLLEVIAGGGHPLSLHRGGVPELIPTAFHADFLADANATALAAQLERCLSWSGAERTQRVRKLRQACAAEQERINAIAAAEDAAQEPLVSPSPRGRRRRGTVSVLVPCFNTPLHWIEDLVWGLNQQSLPPSEVLFIDDGSAPGYAPKLEALLSQALRHPFRLLRHPENLGLPAARNTGLREVRSDYVVNLDSDDIPKRDFLQAYAEVLDRNESAVAATSYLDAFTDGSDWRLCGSLSHAFYRPRGAGVVLGLLENQLGHANSAFRTASLRQVGGWDVHDKSMWEDWALLLKLCSTGERVAVVPRAISLYRYRPDSMSRTGSLFAGQSRLSRNVEGLDAFEARRLVAVLSSATERQVALEKQGQVLRAQHAALSAQNGTLLEQREQLRAQHAAAIAENDVLRQAHAQLLAQHERVRSRLGRRTAEALERHPKLFDALRGLRDLVVLKMDPRNRARLPMLANDSVRRAWAWLAMEEKP